MKEDNFFELVFEDYRNSVILWEKELWQHTEQYFNSELEFALRIIGFNEDEINGFLYFGFITIHNQYQIDRMNNQPQKVFIPLLDKISYDEPLKKTNLDSDLQIAFIGLSMMISKILNQSSESYHEMRKMIDTNKKEIHDFTLKIETYKEVLAKDKTLKETSIDSMVEKLLHIIEDTKIKKPTNKLLSEKTNLSISLWKETITKSPAFLIEFQKKITSKIKFQKTDESTSFWIGVEKEWSTVIEKNIKKYYGSKTKQYKDDYDYGNSDRRYHKNGYRGKKDLKD